MFRCSKTWSVWLKFCAISGWTAAPLTLDFKEAKVLVDDEGAVKDVVIRERSVAEKLIEEFMLVANETVAEHFHWMNVPFIYRIHEEPNAEKLQKFLEFVTTFGYVVKGTAGNIHPRALQSILTLCVTDQRKRLYLLLCSVR